MKQNNGDEKLSLISPVYESHSFEFSSVHNDQYHRYTKRAGSRRVTPTFYALARAPALSLALALLGSRSCLTVD